MILTACAQLPEANNKAQGRYDKYGKYSKSNRHSQHQPIKRYTKEDKDGAPAGPLPSFFQKLIPKNEPLSRYGNPDTYAVSGRNYNILKTAKGYKARGLASWYGTKFHSQRTSSGEHYDMYAMTAAHRTLPLPSYLRVKNLDNGRVAIVKVNDRGPFHSSRLIDLSYAAATKLGILPKGTAHVEIEALSGKGPAPVARYYMQIGAFQSKALATNLQRKTRKFTRTPVYIERYRGRYIVKAGPFANRPSTLALKRQLERQGVRGALTLLQ
jgi:rare lipoprotein A